jgi:hypothetical protein
MIATSARDPSQISTKPPIFREAEEPLQADEWLSMIEQRFQLLRLIEGMKASYVGHHLQGPAGIWWNHHRTTFPANIEVVWDQFKEAFRGTFYSSWSHGNQAHRVHEADSRQQEP